MTAPFGSLVDVEVNMEMILSGDQISFTMWPAGNEKPSAPQIQVIDSEVTAPGGVGLFVDVSNQWQTSGERLIVDFFQCSQSPSRRRACCWQQRLDSPDAGDGEPVRQERLLWIAEDDGVVGGDIDVRASRGVSILSRRNNANSGWQYYDGSLKSGGRITSQVVGTSAIEFLTRNSSERSTWTNVAGVTVSKGVHLWQLGSILAVLLSGAVWVIIVGELNTKINIPSIVGANQKPQSDELTGRTTSSLEGCCQRIVENPKIVRLAIPLATTRLHALT